MRSTSMWFRYGSHLALAGLGALWTLQARGTLLAAPQSALALPRSVGTRLLAIAAALAVSWLTVRSTRVLVARAHWARRLHRALRATLLGTSPSQMVLLAGLSAWSEELLFRAALGPSVGFVSSSALFGLLHLGSRESYLQRATWSFGMGLIFSGLYLGSGTLLVPVLAHAVINYENMQYICNYDPTPLDMDRHSVGTGYETEG